MKTFIFPATCDFGVGSYHEPVMVEVALSEKDAKKLIKYAEEGEESFAECEALEAIYEKVYEKAVKQMTEEFIESGDADNDDPDWRIDDDYECEVDYPDLDDYDEE